MSGEISLEQLSRQIGDERRKLHALHDQAAFVHRQQLGLRNALQTCCQSEVAGIKEELAKLLAERSRLIERKKKHFGQNRRA